MANKNGNQRNSDKSNEISYKVTKLNYLKSNAKMKSNIKYPEISGLSDKQKQEHINKILKDEALKVLKYYENPYGFLDLNIDYKISLKNNNILSIQYSGDGYVSHAAHPNNLFYTTNIDMKTGKRIRLKDVVNIDENFINKFKSGEFKALWPEQSQAIKGLSTETIRKYFQEADSLDNIGTDKQSDVFSYFTTDSLGISIGVSHVYGDHAEFEIKYQDIKDNIKINDEINILQGIGCFIAI